MNSEKYSNHASFFPTQQAPLVSQERLQAVVRKVARGDRFKGKKQQDFIIKTHQHNGHELMTSLSHSRQKAKGRNRRDSFYMHLRKLVSDKIIPIYQYRTSMYSVKPSEDRKEQKESQFKWTARSPFHQNHDVMDEGIKVVAGSRENVNRLVARKRYTASEYSGSHVKEDDNSSMTISKQFLVQLAFIFIMIINVIGSGLSMDSLKLKWVIGLATLVCGNGERLEPADSPPTFPPDSFGGKRLYAYILPYTNVYALWMHYFDRYIKNLDSEYGTMSFYKLTYLYICAFDSSWMTLERATLSSKIVTMACNILHTLVYLLSE